jgi:ribosome biogenesis protein SSF1/2
LSLLQKKTKTQKPDLSTGPPNDKIPRSFVLRRGRTDKSVLELMHDIRRVMLPYTSTKLRETKQNSLKDFVSVASPLGVTHLILLTQTKRNVLLRIGRIPRGPTLTFRIDQYTPGRLIRASQKRPVDIATAFESSPLVVLHGFGNTASAIEESTTGSNISTSNALKLIMATFQNMFPAINPATVKLASCRRVVLVHYHKETNQVEFRHYVIRAVPVGISKGIKKLLSSNHVPDLSGASDVSDYVLSSARDASGAASDSEYEDNAHSVTLPGNYAGRGNVAESKSSIKLSEIGPRMSLTLLKIEQELCGGETLFHAFVKKSEAEIQALRKSAKEKVALKEERKKLQEANVKKKQAVAEEKKKKKEEKKSLRQQAAVEAAKEGKLGDDIEEDVSDLSEQDEDRPDDDDDAGDSSMEDDGEGEEDHVDLDQQVDDGIDDDEEELEEEEEEEEVDEDAPSAKRTKTKAEKLLEQQVEMKEMMKELARTKTMLSKRK